MAPDCRGVGFVRQGARNPAYSGPALVGRPGRMALLSPEICACQFASAAAVEMVWWSAFSVSPDRSANMAFCAR